MEFPNPDYGEFTELEEVQSYKKSEDSANISYQGREGEGQLLPSQCDAATAEHDLHLQGVQGVQCTLHKDGNVGQLN